MSELRLIPFEVPQTLKATAPVMILAAVIMPASGMAQRSLAPTMDDVEQQLLQRIEEQRATEGFGSPAVIEPLMALGRFYEEHEEYELAVAAFEQARQVVRLNDGLYSLDQAPALSQRIRNEEARGNIETAWNLEQELLTLAQRYPDDLRTVGIFRELAGKRVDLLERYAAGERPPQITLGCYYASPHDPDAPRPEAVFTPDTPLKNCRSGSRRRALTGIRQEALNYYAEAIEVLLHHELYSSDELRALEMEAVRVVPGSPLRCGSRQLEEILELELLGSCLEPLLNRNGDTVVNVGGAASLVRLFVYELRSSAPMLSRMSALIDVVDLEFLSAPGRNEVESALQMYEQIYRQLRESGLSQASIDELFAPTIPVVLPAFLPQPLASERSGESAEYIDVGFDITRYGAGRRIAVLDSTPRVTRADERRLVRLIARSDFRPRIFDDEIADASRVVVRYYLND